MANIKSFVKETLPEGIKFILDGTSLHICMSSKGITDNMQKNHCAFEGWAICLKANYPEHISKVIVEWQPLDTATLSDAEKGHYNRFLYRALKFRENYPSWVELNPGIGENFASEISHWVLNYPLGISHEPTSSNPESESRLERRLLPRMREFFDIADHQLPVGLFYENIAESTARTPRQGSQIDLWAFRKSKYSDKGSLYIFELKNNRNRSVGILSELMFYTNVMKDFVDRRIDYPSEFLIQKKHFRSSEALYDIVSKKNVNEIQGILLAERLHPFITWKALELLKSGKNNRVHYRALKVSELQWILSSSGSIEEYANNERKRQCLLYYKNKYRLWDGAENMGAYNHTDSKGHVTGTSHYKFVLQHADGEKNLYGGIRKDALEYFKRYNIAWWRQKEDGYAPTGHLMSSQNHCLNHLFAIRTDSEKVLSIINSIQKRVRYKKVLPVFIDDKDENSYIAFEFVYENRSLLGENHQTRGADCTSVDAMIYAEDECGKKWLLPIEWKYTEHYDMLKTEYEPSLCRYRKLISPDSNLKGWSELFDSNPLYEFARQTLLMEKIISSKECNIADDYLHLIVIPRKNEGLRKIVSDLFVPNLKNPEKVIISNPEDLLMPIADDYISYLEQRYW